MGKSIGNGRKVIFHSQNTKLCIHLQNHLSSVLRSLANDLKLNIVSLGNAKLLCRSASFLGGGGLLQVSTKLVMEIYGKN